MSTPAFVLHGVANRDEAAFTAQVAALEDRVGGAGGQVTLVPVYWGDLGARTQHLDAVIPGVGADLPPGLAESLLGGAPGAAGTRDALDGPAAVAAAADATAAAAGTASSPGIAPRSVAARSVDAPTSGPAALPVAVPTDEAAPSHEAAVRAAWPHLHHLPLVTDPALLADVGRLLGATSGAAAAAGDGVTTRGLGDWVSDRLRDLDVLVGRVVGNAAGTVNASVRSLAAPAIAGFLGDVLVYQRTAGRIRDRVREVVARWDSGHDAVGLGTRQAPATLVGHSLGGVIAVDLATGSPDPLWTDRVVTFGSQWPLFQLIDPRLADAPAFTGTPLTLPPSLGAWTNLWETLDPLAFLAARAFRLATGVAVDVEVTHLASWGLFTHSVYWRADELAAAIAAP